MVKVTGTRRSETLFGSAGNDQIFGLEGNDLLSGRQGADSLIGGIGNDTYIVDNIGDKIIEKANEGTDTVQASISFILASNIENLTLTGTKAINATGNNASNILTGNNGLNYLDGKAGADTMIGGLGNDSYVVDNAGDVVTETSGGGLLDLVQSSISYTLAANVERLVLIGAKAINGTGNELNNALTGNDASNSLNGGLGADTMVGGLGSDTYVVDNIGDKAIEFITEGLDMVRASVSYTLGDHIENLVLTGALAINGTGNDLQNRLTGNAAANLLDGRSGGDTMAGGDGDDTYVIDDTGDIVSEAMGKGYDSVQSSLTYALTGNVEQLTLTGAGAINGLGNELDNRIIGNDASNTINGGLGADTMVGHGGDDTYVVDDAGDVTTEEAGQGTDTVRASMSWVLAANIENLTLAGSDDIDGTGNELSNVLTGNSGANILDGGAALDTLMGEEGDDIYVLADGNDVVIENSGFDTITSTVSRDLNDYDGVEALTLLGSANISATASDTGNYLTGNSGDNTLTGGSGADTLDGGAGADAMDGGDGDDIYYVDSASDAISEQYVFNGDDWVYSSITYTLAAEMENITLLGSSDINATGNADSNTIIGNNGSNILDGGSAGVDRLTGGDGNDTYIVNGDTWLITENANEGVDTVIASTGHIGLTSGLENGTLTGSLNRNIVGTTSNNVMVGNTGTNNLTGLGGNDTMTGGGGNDTFWFATYLGVTRSNFGHDTITDFSAGNGTGDVLRVGTQFDSLTGLVQDNRIVDDGQGNCTITFDVLGNSSSSITLLGVTASQLVADDFDFRN